MSNSPWCLNMDDDDMHRINQNKYREIKKPMCFKLGKGPESLYICSFGYSHHAPAPQALRTIFIRNWLNTSLILVSPCHRNKALGSRTIHATRRGENHFPFSILQKLIRKIPPCQRVVFHDITTKKKNYAIQ